MLSTAEIVELEKKVLKYRLKQKIYYAVYIILFFMITGSVVYFYFNSLKVNLQANNLPHSETNISTVVQNIETNLTKHEILASNESENNKTELSSAKVEETLILQLPAYKANTTHTQTTTKELFPKEEALDNTLQLRKKPMSHEEAFYRSIEETIKTGSIMDPPPLGEIKERGVIKIETQEVNSITYLKEKFEKTHNIIFALMLCEEYYLTKNYEQSNKWALIANSIDAENEKSWIWFAKSKMKLGKKEDAITALKAYLKNNKSSAIQSLLNQINFGELND